MGKQYRTDLSDAEIRRDFLMMVQAEAIKRDFEAGRRVARKVLFGATRIKGSTLRGHKCYENYFMETLVKYYVSYSYGLLGLPELEDEPRAFTDIIMTLHSR